MDQTFRAVAETVTDAVISADRHGDIIYVNKGGERLFGWTAAALRGRPLTVLMPERFRQANGHDLERFANDSHPHPASHIVELTGLRQDGREFPMELSLARRSEENGIFLTVIIRDISERQRRDEELRAVNAQLQMANKELETFSYSVSHDLRAPIRSIDGFSAILQQDYGDKLDQRGRDCLNRVRASAQRMYALIDAMLILSRVTREEMRRDVVDLSAIARSAGNELQRTHQGRAVTFTVAPGVVAVGDGSLIRLALENLLNNAWKFTSKQPDARVEFGVTSGSAGEAYFVRDNGAGFDMTYADKLFGAFQRLHTEDEFPGTGVGLATVQRIVHRHGGRTWAEGQVGRGATIYFTLSPDSEATPRSLQLAARSVQ